MRYPVTIEKDTNGTILVSFVDLPAHSVGATREEALVNALDALETAIEGLIARRAPVPQPSRTRRGQAEVSLPAQSSAKIALWNALLDQGLSNLDLARRLDWQRPQVDRLFDMRQVARLDRLEQAASALGKRIEVRVA